MTDDHSERLGRGQPARWGASTVLRRLRELRERRNESGAAAVEFALVGLILVTLLIGIIQFAIWFWGYQAGSHAAREGARFAAVNPCTSDDADIIAYANGRAGELAPITGAPASTVTRDMSVTGDSTNLDVGDEITVQVSFAVVDFGLVPGFPSTVTKAATSRVEHIPTTC